MTRTPIRVPGFPESLPSDPPTAPTRSPAQARTPALRQAVPATPALHRRAGVRQLNVRVQVPLLQRYRSLLRALEDDGFDTSMAELTQALLYQGPETTAEAKQTIRAWRRALDPDA